MQNTILKKRTKAQESSGAIERLYITMKHLFTRGFYKPMGVSGDTLKDALLQLKPEIYGSMAEEKVELKGLLYVIQRLPEGIEECRYINLTANEGYANSHFIAIVPKKRRRNCYRIDRDQMNIEVTRGRSEIYDILTHLTFLFNEAQKIADTVLLKSENYQGRAWHKLEEVVLKNQKLSENQQEIMLMHLSGVLGRTFEETQQIYHELSEESQPERFIHLVYWLGKRSIDENLHGQKRYITFSQTLREQIGHHIYGEVWADKIKKVLFDKNLIFRPLHIISANMHSVMNSLYANHVLADHTDKDKPNALYELLSKEENEELQKKVTTFARQNGLTYIQDVSGANIDVQVIDTSKIMFEHLNFKTNKCNEEEPVIIVMDYAFGEQAYETMDELLKPYLTKNGEEIHLPVSSISIMGKAGTLQGNKGDIMIPFAHIFEGTADNYPFENELTTGMFEGHGVDVFDGAMVTVLGTSLQNKDILDFFQNSTWKVTGLEMEGAHYQKAIQAASKIRGNIDKDIKVRYAYYASDNPLKTGGTLASGGLGLTGVMPTYLITQKILEQVL